MIVRDVPWDPTIAYQMEFLGHPYKLTACGCLDPATLFESYVLENRLREAWWNINPGDVVVDVGSAWGSYAITALAQGAGFVVAIDPDKESYFSLETNLQINQCQDRCWHVPAMIGDREGTADYYPQSHSNRIEGVAEKRIITKLDTIAKLLPPVNWLKIDVEGMEEEVIAGAAWLLETYHPTIFLENHTCFNPAIPDNVSKLLTPLGYTEERLTVPEGCWSLWCHSQGAEQCGCKLEEVDSSK